jgi:hypothetical protein
MLPSRDGYLMANPFRVLDWMMDLPREWDQPKLREFLPRCAMTDFDSPWKEALDLFLQAFMAFFFPEIHTAIDWSRGYESLDKELQQVASEAEVGRRLADKLYRVWRLDGAEAWVLIHIEIQTQPDEEFAERMFVYNYLLYDRFRRPVVSLAVLGDDRSGWRPSNFGYELWGCKLQLEFPVVKLLDFRNDLAHLEARLIRLV